MQLKRKTASGQAEEKEQETHKKVKKCLHTKTHTKSEKVCTQNDGTKECKNEETAGVACDGEESDELSDKQSNVGECWSKIEIEQRRQMGERLNGNGLK